MCNNRRSNFNLAIKWGERKFINAFWEIELWF